MKARLDLIESRLQDLIEGSISLLMPRANLRQSLAHELVESMRIHLVNAPDGKFYAPGRYLICTNLASGKSWLSNPLFLNDLTNALEETARDAGFLFYSKPIIQITADDSLPPGDLRIEIPTPTQELSQTSSISLRRSTPPDEPQQDISLLHAFLIVNSTNNYRLDQSVVNIGRGKDNHLILEDLRVSRVHAQLRLIKGRYNLFDLNSKGGTFVNDQRITRCILNPGDVISLAGVPLIYGQDITPNVSTTTQFDTRSASNSLDSASPERRQQIKGHKT